MNPAQLRKIAELNARLRSLTTRCLTAPTLHDAEELDRVAAEYSTLLSLPLDAGAFDQEYLWARAEEAAKHASRARYVLGDSDQERPSLESDLARQLERNPALVQQFQSALSATLGAMAARTDEWSPDTDFPNPDSGVPEVLYKYSSEKGIDRFLKARQLHFSEPAAFNDPFDTALDLGTREDELSAALRGGLNPRSLFAPGHPALDGIAQSQLEHASNLLDELFTEQTGLLQGIKKAHRDRLERVLNAVGILCLSNTSHGLLLWAHYAAGHAGLCFGFRGLHHRLKGLRFYRVDYERDFVPLVLSPELLRNPKLAGAALLRPALRRTIATKSIEWAYEREWRAVVPEAGSVKFPPECLDQVIIGLRADPLTARVRRELSAPEFAHVKLRRAVRRPGSFTLDIVPLDIP